MTQYFNIIYKMLPTHIMMSERQRAKYVKEGKKLNKTQQKKLDNNEYCFIEGKLYDKVNHEFVILNKDKIGTPRMAKITGQQMWSSGRAVIHYRKELKEQLTLYFLQQIPLQLPEKIFPPKGKFIQMEYIYYIHQSKITKKQQDVNNFFYLYVKIFGDVLQEMKVISGDDPTVYRGDYYRYVGVPETEEELLEIKIHFCGNDQPMESF